MLDLTPESIQAALESILADPPSSDLVRDQLTGSVGLSIDDFGSKPDKYGKPIRFIHVKVKKPGENAHHKVGDCVIWGDPLPCGL